MSLSSFQGELLLIYDIVSTILNNLWMRIKGQGKKNNQSIMVASTNE